MNKRNDLKIFIIAGEASGDNLGAKLMKSLKEISPNISFYGIGGDKMKKQGLNSLFPMHELSIMGFVEIIPYIPKFFYRLNQTINCIKKIQPDIIITIDSPGFNFRVAKRVNSLGIKLVHYVAPTVWAYKPERAKKIASIYDHLLVLLPWEPSYFVKEGLNTSFIGHPIIEDIAQVKLSNFREKYKIDDSNKIIALFPGSRKNEIKTLLPVFMEAIEILKKSIDDIVLIIPTLPHLTDIIKNILSDYNDRTIIISDEIEKKEALSVTDFAIVKSGTVSFDVALYKIPMVIAYRINSISAFMLRKMIKIKMFNLINLINDEEVIPELIQEKCTGQNIAVKALEILKNDQVKIKQLEAFEKAFIALGSNDFVSPSDKAAKIIMELI